MAEQAGACTKTFANRSADPETGLLPVHQFTPRLLWKLVACPAAALAEKLDKEKPALGFLCLFAARMAASGLGRRWEERVCRGGAGWGTAVASHSAQFRSGSALSRFLPRACPPVEEMHPPSRCGVVKEIAYRTLIPRHKELNQ